MENANKAVRIISNNTDELMAILKRMSDENGELLELVNKSEASEEEKQVITDLLLNMDFEICAGIASVSNISIVIE